MYPPAGPSFGHPDVFRSKGHAAFKGEPRSSGALFRERIMPKGKDSYNVRSVNGKGSYLTQVEVPSPSPVPSSNNDKEISLESPAPISRLSSVDILKPLAENRRKLNLHRPSLTRSKGFSTSAIPARSHPEDRFPSFKFGADGRPGSSSPQLSLSECFEDSPPRKQKMPSFNSPCANIAGALRSKAHFQSLSGTRNGSPIASHSRRGSNPHLRPRKQYRRSQSMFESTGDVIKPKKDLNVPVTNLQSVTDIEEPAELALPHFFPAEQNDSIPRVSRDTFLEILDGKYNAHYDHKLIIDCRFEYEYDGGHVDGAINYNDKELLASHLFQSPLKGGRSCSFTASTRCTARLSWPGTFGHKIAL
ncbi:m-phase inducer phosphatase [Cytospora paraplurivora]|uniref:protein-tyrosine-phosphatase n=1 Tax=Cytospora paraplurivora TaxID=2898453 RepID=A0AAN9UA16_9PEZI